MAGRRRARSPRDAPTHPTYHYQQYATTALDIGIGSPDAQQAGADCVLTVLQRKMEYYGPHLGALERQNIEYLPLI